MTTTVYYAIPRQIDSTEFRDWGSKTSAAFAAVGMVKTADTGQIDWATVVTPVSVNTFQGYEIWRFNDALQSTAPIFLKIEYGAGPSNTARPCLRVTVGKGSNGSGTLTSAFNAALVVDGGTIGTSVNPWYMSSGDGSMLCFAPAPAIYGATTCWNIVVERSRDSAGVATGTSFYWSYQSGTGVNVRAYNYAAATGITTTYWPVAPPSQSAGVAGGGKAALFPAILTDGVGNWWQPRSVLVGLINDIGNMSTFDVPGWGTYLPITGMITYDGAVSANARAAIAWY